MIMANPSNPVQNPNEAMPGGTARFVSDPRSREQGITQKTREMASDMTEQAREVATSVTGKAGELASNVGHKAEEAASSVGGSMRSLAGTIKQTMPQKGVLGQASSAVADSLEGGGRYLQEEGLKGIAGDFTNLIRRNPIPALLVGIGIGFLIARATRS
jgi:hypothetical protein